MRFIAILLLFLLPVGAAWAQGDIHRCTGANGVPVFTDRICSDVNATPVMPAPSSSAQAPVELSQPPPVLCAADMAHLKQAVIDAFAARNPNRLAGLMLWGDDGEQAVVADIRVLGRLMAHPLIDVKVVPADDPPTPSTSALPSPKTGQGEALLVQTESDDGSGATQETRFEVLHQSGCLWLQLQN
ncbi:hypothetical protein GCM10007862_23260 [Dyella lipolytica]|uniref:DUF4124 domain-containing protein n=1 Tax=Dyella lipolytica TaxID=1867835 RepID=A0ABW8IR31_9GAMM|nr:DUF4124 domain-containing protein [Dyella lipolytica]GLQ47275.1 hypothetical protein GCM10007862_23260 [Dyella lipolytica]